MLDALLEWRRYRYFPYELDLARLEAERLFGTTPRDDARGVRIASSAFRPDVADRLTYFGRAVQPNGNVIVPRQARLEATAHIRDQHRQATRYSAHGLHEYKGKFNPQVVRAIGNILGLRENAWVLDPFCGSGTTLLECAHTGWNARGIDRNPLAVRVARAKLRALRSADGALQHMAEAVARALDGPPLSLSGERPISNTVIEQRLGPRWLEELPSTVYLLSWFPVPVLAQVVAILRVLRKVVSAVEDQAVFEVILSDHLRNASYQEPADLRIRRRKSPQQNYPLVSWYLETLSERITRVARARQTLGSISGQQDALLADICSTCLPSTPGFPPGGFDAIITSPPYETALPYIDTQRLSLILFGDIKATEVQATEKALIGAREIGGRERHELEEMIRTGDRDLPRSVIGICQELLHAASKPGNGFRRRNRPALVYRYFRSMARFFTTVVSAVRPAGYVALVVGPNRTALGGKEFRIDTPSLLIAVAEHLGYTLVEQRSMDAYPRYDLHQQNSIVAEKLIIVAAP